MADLASIIANKTASDQDWKAQKQAERENAVSMRDAAATEIATAELYAAANPGLAIANNFRFVIDPSTSGTRIGMPKGEDELTAKINEIIAEVIEQGLYEKWYAEYTEYASSLGID